MKKTFLYIGSMIAMVGVLGLTNPVISHAEPTAVAADEVALPEEASESNEGKEETVSKTIQVLSEEDIMAQSGPSLEAQQAKKEAEEAETAAAEAKAAAEVSTSIRQNLVNYALQFVGRPYRAGGNDPHTGADCSGFVKYVMQHAAGVSLNRSSSAQARQGRTVSSAEMQPGDLIFYGSGSSVNHVAMYIGNGQIVHASTYKTGIKVSNWNYRSPVRIASML